MAPNKYDVEIAKIARGMRRDAHFCTNVKTVAMYGTLVFLIWTCGRCVAEIVGGDPASLEWLFKILRDTSVPTLVHSAVTLLLGGTSVLQFARNRRLTQKSGDMRHAIEHNDKSNERSGLTPDGTAREDKEA